MQKLLLSAILALLLALSLAGMKRAFGPASTAQSGTALVADGGPEPPPVPW